MNIGIGIGIGIDINMNYPTRAAAVVALQEIANETGMLVLFKNGEAFLKGDYILSKGEYDRPDYIPTHYKCGWGIAEVHCYFQGSFNVTKRHRVGISVIYDVDKNPKLRVYSDEELQG